jgi:methylated-DNA-[protein]-cysteine S-methyltransferase
MMKRKPSKPFSKWKVKSFTERVRAVVKKIPKGKTMTYGEVAKRAGSPQAARAVGTIMSHNYDPAVPCHRVIRSDGKIGDYNRGGPSKKVELLLQERYQAGLL